jgi:hypothetical protein
VRIQERWMRARRPRLLNPAGDKTAACRSSRWLTLLSVVQQQGRHQHRHIAKVVGQIQILARRLDAGAQPTLVQII